MICVGIDWGGQKHGVHVQDAETGSELLDAMIPHEPEALNELVHSLLKKVEDPDQVHVALETKQGLVVETLLEAGFCLYPINPKEVDAFRNCYRPSRSKNDQFDAWILSEMLKIHRGRLREIKSGSNEARELKILARDYAKLSDDRTRLVNKLTSALKRYYPAVLEWFGKLHQPSTVAFLKAFPSRKAVENASKQDLQECLRRARYPRPQRKAREIKQDLKSQSAWKADPVTVQAQTRKVRHLRRRLEVLLDEIPEYEEAMVSLMNSIQDSDVFKSLPGASKTNLVPRILAEFGDNKDRFKDFNAVQCQAGTAPVTIQSGSSKKVVRRRACSKPFRTVMYRFAFCSLSKSTWARDYYDRKRDEGKKHSEAIRALGNKWVKITFAMWQNGTKYDEDFHMENIARHKEKVA